MFPGFHYSIKAIFEIYFNKIQKNRIFDEDIRSYINYISFY